MRARRRDEGRGTRGGSGWSALLRRLAEQRARRPTVAVGGIRWTLSPLGAFMVWQGQFRLTDQGKALMISIPIAVSIAASSLSIPAYHLLCALCALAVVAYCAGWWMCPRLKVENLLPRKAVAGQEVTGALRVTNPSSRPGYGVSARLFGLPERLQQVSAEEVLPALLPGESETFPVVLKPLRRGLYPLPRACVYCTFPFHLLRDAAGWYRRYAVARYGGADDARPPAGQA